MLEQVVLKCKNMVKRRLTRSQLHAQEDQNILVTTKDEMSRIEKKIYQKIGKKKFQDEKSERTDISINVRSLGLGKIGLRFSRVRPRLLRWSWSLG